MNIGPILIVDSSSEDVELARAYFQDQNITNPIHTAESGRQALAYLESGGPTPTLLLLNLGDLGDMSGSALLSRLRADPRTAALAVIVLRGPADCGPVRVEGQHEPLALLTRPIAFPHLADVVRALDLELVLVSAPEPAPSKQSKAA